MIGEERKRLQGGWIESIQRTTICQSVNQQDYSGLLFVTCYAAVMLCGGGGKGRKGWGGPSIELS